MAAFSAETVIGPEGGAALGADSARRGSRLHRQLAATGDAKTVASLIGAAAMGAEEHTLAAGLAKPAYFPFDVGIGES